MKKNQKGFSLIELLIVVAIILIIAAIAIPNLLRARIAANEASAVGSIRSIVTAEVSYSSTWGVVSQPPSPILVVRFLAPQRQPRLAFSTRSSLSPVQERLQTVGDWCGRCGNCSQPVYLVRSRGRSGHGGHDWSAHVLLR